MSLLVLRTTPGEGVTEVERLLVERCAAAVAGTLPSPGQMHARMRDLGLSPSQVAHLWTAVETRAAELVANPDSFDTAALLDDATPKQSRSLHDGW